VEVDILPSLTGRWGKESIILFRDSDDGVAEREWNLGQRQEHHADEEVVEGDSAQGEGGEARLDLYFAERG
jgi:hypothetical protein